MYETQDGSPDPLVDFAAARYRRRRKAKAHKVLEGKLRLWSVMIFFWTGWKRYVLEHWLADLNTPPWTKKTGLARQLKNGNPSFPMYHQSAFLFGDG